jgi:hypothetical protein
MWASPAISGVEGLGTTEDADFKRHFKLRRGEGYRCGAHVAYGTAPQVVSLGESEVFLATTGRGNGRWNGGQLKVAQDAGNHRFPGNSSNDPQ